jgi:hypothetical protein
LRPRAAARIVIGAGVAGVALADLLTMRAYAVFAGFTRCRVDGCRRPSNQLSSDPTVREGMPGDVGGRLRQGQAPNVAGWRGPDLASGLPPPRRTRLGPRADLHAGLLPDLAPAPRLGAADLHRRGPARPGKPCRPARRSAWAQAKASYQYDRAGQPYRSFHGLLQYLATLTRNQVRFAGTRATVPMLTEPTSAQREAFSLLGVPIPLALK